MNGFAVWCGFGAALGLWRVARSVPPRQAGAWVNSGLFVLFISLIGARLFYAGINWDYFSAHPAQILMVWLGGLAWPGAALGAFLAACSIALVSRGPRARSSSPRLALGWIGDQLYPILPSLSIAAWLGCWQVGAAYGPAAPAGTWWAVPSLDESGLYNLHWPLQPLAALSLLIFFAILEARVRPFSPPGRLSGLAVIGLLVNLLVTSLMRADPAPYWGGARLDTWSAGLLLALFLAYLAMNSLVLHISRSQVSLIP